MSSNVFTLLLTTEPGAAGKSIAQMTANELERRGCRVETLRDEISGHDLKSSLNTRRTMSIIDDSSLFVSLA
jgi:hypothetical protein